MIKVIILLYISINYIYSQAVTDIDGNVYDTVVIGNQVWLKQNLNVSRFNNGDPIPKIIPAQHWENITTAAYSVYNNDPALEAIYGKLYNWLAVSDPRGICPPGYKVPTDNDWTILVNYLGGEMVAGGKLKEAGFAHWAPPNAGADNSSGFTGLPAGMRATNGEYYHLGEIAGWWSITPYDAYNSWMRDVSYDSPKINRSLGKYVGFSCRCIKASTSKDSAYNSQLKPYLYPNPACCELRLKGILNNLEYQMHVYSVFGIPVFSEKVNENYIIDVSTWVQGVYFVKFIVNNEFIFFDKITIVR